MPAVTFNADTLGFCKLVSLPELFLSLIYFTFSVVIGVVGMATVDVTNFFEFYEVHFCRCKLVCSELMGLLFRSTDIVCRWQSWLKATPSFLLGWLYVHVCVCMRERIFVLMFVRVCVCLPRNTVIDGQLPC